MVYGILKLLNFAHGEVFMIGSYIGYFVLTWLRRRGRPEPADRARDRPHVPAARCSAPGSSASSIERFAYRPLREKRAGRIAPLISALGVSFCLQQLAVICFGVHPEAVRLVRLRRRLALHRRVSIGPFEIQYMQLFVIATTVCLMVALTIFIARTQVGRAMRATSFDLEAASMMGIDVDRVIVVTFFIGSVLAGAAGVMNGLIFQNVDPYVGFQVGLIAFTAAVVGGIGSIPGAMLGGLAIGLGRAFAVGYVSSSYQDVIVFAILIGVPSPATVRDLRHAGARRRSEVSDVPRRSLVPSRQGRRSAQTSGSRAPASAPSRRSGRLGVVSAPGTIACRSLPCSRSSSIAALLVPLLTAQTDNDIYFLRVGTVALVFALLALGLNVAVGFAGLLDLGYIAYYGIGAYGYAMLSSDKFGLHWEAWHRHPARRRCLGAARIPARASVAAPRGRLPRDRDALLRPDLLRHRERRATGSRSSA